MTLTVCILGYGKVARDFHYPMWDKLESSGRAKVVAVYEPSPAGREIAGQHWPSANVVDGDGLRGIQEAGAELVDVCTPGGTHAGLVLAAAAAGSSVLVEKPLCHSSSELEAIIRASRSVKISVCQTRRFTPSVISLKKAIDGGRLGTISIIRMSHRARHILNEAEWIIAERPDGMLWEMCVHNVDLVHFLLDLEDPLEIDAARWFEAGSKKILTGVEFMAHDRLGRRVTVDFVQDSIVHSSFESRVFVAGSAADAELYSAPPGWRLMSGLNDPLHDAWLNARRLGTAVRQLARPEERVLPHLGVASDLVEAIRLDRSPAVSPEAVRGTILTLESLSRLWQESIGGR
jgi:predicted dehydrogenase